MANTAYCIAANEIQAVRIVHALRAADFSENDISVLFRDKTGTRDFAHEHHTKAPEGVTVGVSAGGVAGAALGVLAGLGALAIPGVGPLIAAGPVLAGMSGAAAGAAVGGLVGGLVGLGIPEFEAKLYEGKLHEGGILMSAHCMDSERLATAKRTFASLDATDITTGTASHEKAA